MPNQADNNQRRGLTTLRGVTAALRAVYRDMKSKKMDTKEAKDHTYVLKTLHDLMLVDTQHEDFEARLAELEAQLNGDDI